MQQAPKQKKGFSYEAISSVHTEMLSSAAALAVLRIYASIHSGTVLTNESTTASVLSHYVTVSQYCFEADSTDGDYRPLLFRCLFC
jgi:hypothetical protein